MSTHVIICAADRTVRDRARQAVLRAGAGNAVTAELPIIDGFAADVSGDLHEVRQLDGVRVVPDETLHVPDTTNPATDMLDKATRTLNVQPLWQQGLRGQGVGIALVDTGVAPHRDLRDRIVAFQDLVNHKSKPYDDDGHGTHVAGIAAGNGAESGGRYSGIAPAANIVAIKAFDDGGSAKSSNVIAGIQWAVENKQTYNIRVLNLSIGGKASVPAHLDPMALAVEQAIAAGIFVVTAAGNSGPGAQSIETPGISQNAITVGNLDQNYTTDRKDDSIYGSSSRGPSPLDGFAKPEVCAPGTNITSCNTDDGYVQMTGTSMAAPMVAGAAALLIGAHAEVTPAQLKQAFIDTAAPLRKDPVNAQGSGMIDPSVAITKL